MIWTQKELIFAKFERIKSGLELTLSSNLGFTESSGELSSCIQNFLIHVCLYSYRLLIYLLMKIPTIYLPK